MPFYVQLHSKRCEHGESKTSGGRDASNTAMMYTANVIWQGGSGKGGKN